MRTNLTSFEDAQVFLNYPFDNEFKTFSHAMHFAVVAAGLIPVCAYDLTAPDRPRLDIIVEAIIRSRYSVHDFSRLRGEGEQNFARHNMPIEMGMALFHALQTQRSMHRCAFFISVPHEFRIAASDLAGLDPITYEGDELSCAARMYEWLRDGVRSPYTQRVPTVTIVERYRHFKAQMKRIEGSGRDGQLSHDEAQELMFSLCSESDWWDWREIRFGQAEFPIVPLSWREVT
jgi:hypothetical protein